MAYSLGPEAKLPTVLKLRDQMGVSLRTLDGALKALEADNIIYRIQGVGIFVSPSLQRHVALMCMPDFFEQVGVSPFWRLMVESATERAKAKNEAFSCHFTIPGGHKGAPMHAGLAREIEAREMHGVLGIGLDENTVAWIEERGIPYVAFAGSGRWTVGLDNEQLLDMGVKELASLGCKRLSCWSTGLPFERSGPTDRAGEIELENEKDSMWRKALQEHGLEIHEELSQNLAHLDCVGYSHQEQGFNLAHDIFSAPRSTWPDGILCYDDLMTHGLLLALEKMDMRVGQDVHIVSHANRNSPVLMGREHQITRLEYDPAEIVRMMFDILETVMDGGVYGTAITRVKPTLYQPTR
jgi:DNA-binding LacI/PurR family transcriptional regulator